MPGAAANGRRLLLALSLALAGCSAPAETTPSASCTPDGSLDVVLYGSLDTTIEWSPGTLECEGMPRPHGAGARLRFAGPVVSAEGEQRLAIIVALPDLEPGVAHAELQATVTLIDEQGARFFSTGDAEVCWSDVKFQRPLSDSPDNTRYAIGGILYCVAPLAEMNGDGSVTLVELRYAGQLDWRQPK